MSHTNLANHYQTTMNQLCSYISVVISCTLFLWVRSRRARRHGSLPPSPKSDPLIGNLRTMTNIVDEPRAYRDWGVELGSDIISITIPGKVIIVLNSQEAIDELLIKRSAIYSDRPHIPMVASETLVGWGHSTGIIRYGERWRFQRKLTHEALHKTECEERWPLLESQARLALQRMLASPTNFSQEIRCMAGSMMLMTVYGYEVTSEDDSLFRTVEEAVLGFSQALVVQMLTNLVNTFPWLEYIPKWFPGTEWKAKADEWRHLRDLMLHVPFEWTKNRMSAGTSVPCMLSSLLTRYMRQDSDLPVAELEDCIRWASGGMFAAGITPVVNSIRVFIIAMAMHPDIQAKAQAEIDNTIGTRLPEVADLESLSYVRCIIKEVLRWRLTLPLAVPHASIQDDTYKGYFIPKGAIVAISNNPAVYPDPACFNPDRFLDPSVPDAPAFGYGRRICPGLFYSEATLFIVAASMLSAFNIHPEVDAKGKQIPLRAEMAMNEAVRQLRPFQCRITPRSEKHEQMIREPVEI
ncbi:cytochrome P450 family protein [Rhizoctonia solani 123E]|uniref:Cytochrome P450 family protein n=1 Tax=Rhizoctonia solani 123E TaxID=1423351 RepID=A0A074S8J2_9AGAM|nr:cytochrome P450 family protein [Rhizoctonia solani 123E]